AQEKGVGPVWCRGDDYARGNLELLCLLVGAFDPGLALRHRNAYRLLLAVADECCLSTGQAIQLAVARGDRQTSLAATGHALDAGTGRGFPQRELALRHEFLLGRLEVAHAFDHLGGRIARQKPRQEEREKQHVNPSYQSPSELRGRPGSSAWPCRHSRRPVA